MKLLRFSVRILLVIPMILWGLFVVNLIYPIIRIETKNRLNQGWSRVLMWVSGIRVTVIGTPIMEGATFWVANHISWTDIFVLNTVRATSFIAKSEIRDWPIIGRLVAGAGTLFLERGQRNVIQRMSADMKLRFEQGDAIGLFPEGTTSTGEQVLPFYGSLFEPARTADVPIQPIAFRYLHHGQRSGFAAFVGDETLVHNLWRILGTTGLEIHLVFLPELQRYDEQGQMYPRTALAEQAYEAIAHAVNPSSSAERLS